MNTRLKTILSILALAFLNAIFVFLLSNYATGLFSESISRTGLSFLDTIALWDNNVPNPWISLQPLLAIQNAYFFIIVKTGLSLHFGQNALLFILLTSTTTWSFLSLKNLLKNHTHAFIATISILIIYILYFTPKNTAQIWFMAFTPLWIYLIERIIKTHKSRYVYTAIIATLPMSVIALDPILLLSSVASVMYWASLRNKGKDKAQWNWKKTIFITISILLVNSWWIASSIYYIKELFINDVEITNKKVELFSQAFGRYEYLILLPFIFAVLFFIYKEKNKRILSTTAIFFMVIIILNKLAGTLLIELLKTTKNAPEFFLPAIFGITAIIGLSIQSSKKTKNKTLITYSIYLTTGIILIATYFGLYIKLDKIYGEPLKITQERGDYKTLEIGSQIKNSSIQIISTTKEKTKGDEYQKKLKEAKNKNIESALQKTTLNKGISILENPTIVTALTESVDSEHLYENTTIVIEGENISTGGQQIITGVDEDLNFCVSKKATYTIKQMGGAVFYEPKIDSIRFTTSPSLKLKEVAEVKNEPQSVAISNLESLLLENFQNKEQYTDLTKSGLITKGRNTIYELYEKTSILEFEENFSDKNQNSWEESLVDCNKYEDKTMEEIGMQAYKEQTQDNSYLHIETNDHTACVSKNIEINDQGLYRLEFDHQKIAGQDSGSVTLIYRWENHEEQKTITLKRVDGWSTHQETLLLDNGIQSIDIIFRISGENEKNAIQIDNVILKKNKKVDTISIANNDITKTLEKGCYQIKEESTKLPLQISYIDPSFDEKEWEKNTVNCHNYKNQTLEEAGIKSQNTTRDEKNGESFEIQGQEGIACSGKTLQNLKKGEYTLQIDHKTISGSKEAEIKITNQKTGKILTHELLPISKDWSTSSFDFLLKENIDSATIVLLVQTSQDTIHKHAFDNIELSYMSKILAEDILVTTTNHDINPGKITAITEQNKQAFNLYQTNVQNEENLFIALNQTYHPGWQLSSEGSKNSKHFIVNESKNGWQIENREISDLKIQFLPDAMLKKLYLISALSMLMIVTIGLIHATRFLWQIDKNR